MNRAARQARIQQLITQETICSQAELSRLLSNIGICVSQSTLSKDLLEIGAVRVRDSSGALIYAKPDSDIVIDLDVLESRLAKIAADVLISVDYAQNLVIMKTPPGAAQYFASAIDKVARPEIVGSIAGDDTVMVIARTDSYAKNLVDWFVNLSEGTEL